MTRDARSCAAVLDRDGSLQSALSRALETASVSRVMEMPSALRTALLRELGAEPSLEQRAAVHLIVAAADERLPQLLVTAAPVDRAQEERLATELAEQRGWSLDAARGVVALWVQALGVADETPPPSDVAVDVSGPARVISAGEPAARLLDETPSGVSYPIAASAPDPLPPDGASSRRPVAVPDLPDVSVPWPHASGRRVTRVRTLVPEAEAAYPAFHPRSPVWRVVTGAVALVALVAVFALTGLAAGVVPIALVGLLAMRLAPEGTLVVDAHGARYFPTLRTGAVPTATVGWGECDVTPGIFPVVSGGGARIWLRPGSGNLVGALSARARSSGEDR